MQFKKGAAVTTADGENVGGIDRVVIDPQSNEITHLVVRKGFLFSEDKVVPISLVAQAKEDGVSLRKTEEALQDLPPFEEAYYVSDDAQKPVQAAYVQPLYWYPPLGAAAGNYLGTYPTPPAEYVAVERNIPEGAVALREGAKVIARDGGHVGDIARVFTDANTPRVTHFLLVRGLLNREHKLIPTTWVKKVEEDQVQLSVGSQLIDELKNYEHR